jgi:hypothetical protein
MASNAASECGNLVLQRIEAAYCGLAYRTGDAKRRKSVTAGKTDSIVNYLDAAACATHILGKLVKTQLYEQFFCPKCLKPLQALCVRGLACWRVIQQFTYEIS